jgi:hypothetical protein
MALDERAQHIESVHAGHAQIQEHHSGRKLTTHRDAGFAVRGFCDAHSLAFQYSSENATHPVIVVHDQHGGLVSHQWASSALSILPVAGPLCLYLTTTDFAVLHAVVK